MRFSALKESEDGLSTVLRFYQTGEETVETRIRTYKKAKEVSLCNLLEEKGDKVISNSHEFMLTLEPKKIITLRIDWSDQDD